MNSSNSTDIHNLTGNGATIFAENCSKCHGVRSMPGQDTKGPSFENIVGKKAASGSPFNFSSAHKKSNITWDDKTLFEFLLAPKQYIKGTKMNHPGVKDPTKRSDLIAYLTDKTSSVINYQILSSTSIVIELVLYSILHTNKRPKGT
ncbi:Aste57867_2379 [Aphanomyces stellatus]|uniref:Aste57867_2379 protein n=1 Tax=Aphanomyces stellatus TaxID=120398 RepID=A0A485K850_9STRA|nr:hypothetical protein As57867_002373 [Aphanomyces stellatus]VFT79580.1 Aste57867_2379 [Aphanomyces stellatus]